MGLPDYTKAVKLYAMHNGVLTPVVVDSAGQLYALLKGYTGTLYVPLKVDSKGQLYTLIRGSAGEAIAVDADGNLSAVMYATYGTVPKKIQCDTDGQLIAQFRGKYGDYWLPFAVDANGYMTAVMKGQYGAELKTVGVDDQGRITVFLCDAQDVWGNVVNVGNSELAARMGSIKTYDRRGDVLFIDNFEHGLGGYQPTETGTGADVLLSTLTKRTGAYSAKIVTSAVNGEESGIDKLLPLPSETKLGLETSFTLHSEDHYIKISVIIYDGTNVHRAEVRYNHVTETWQYYSSAAAWVALSPTIDLDQSVYLFHTAKLVLDLAAAKYVRLMCDAQTYDMSTISYRKVASAVSPLVYWHIGYYTNASTPVTGYVDGMILTQNEPA